MNTCSTLATLGVSAWLALCAPQAWAGEGHDHGDAPPAVSGPALPRFAAVSETFELVGIVNGTQLTVYLDRYADNTPVKDAKVELELGGVKVPLETHAAGEFEAKLAQGLKPGVIPVAATVIAGAETDLLAGELDLHEAEGAHAQEPGHAHGWTEYALWIAVAGSAAGAFAWFVRRARRTGKRHPGGAA